MTGLLWLLAVVLAWLVAVVVSSTLLPRQRRSEADRMDDAFYADARAAMAAPLSRGSLVEIVAGRHAGLCGRVEEIALDTAGRETVGLVLQDDTRISADREDVMRLDS